MAKESKKSKGTLDKGSKKRKAADIDVVAEPSKKKKGNDKGKKVIDGSRSDEESKYPRLCTRSTLRRFAKVIKKLNPAQTAAVNEIRFGGLLHMKIVEIPAQLTYWLVKIFNPVSCELVISKRKKIHVDATDVERVLGIPNGSVNIERKNKAGGCELYKEWLEIFNKPNNHITAKHVATEMLKFEDGGDWFKRHFVALVDCLIIGNNPIGYVNPLMMDSLENVHNIRNLGWCEYTINTLVTNHARWGEGKQKMFSGPLLFLSVFYLDRVVFYTRDVTRTLPSIRGWTSQIIKKRVCKEMKEGGFGQGHLAEPLRTAVLNEGSGAADIGLVGSQSAKAGTSSGIESHEEYKSRLLKKLSGLATYVVDIIALLENAPKEMTGDADFCKLQDSAMMLICSASKHTLDAGGPHADDMSETQLTQAFWNNPETIAAVEKVEIALGRREEYEKGGEDLPSFSLGVTQEPVKIVGRDSGVSGARDVGEDGVDTGDGVGDSDGEDDEEDDSEDDEEDEGKSDENEDEDGSSDDDEGDPIDAELEQDGGDSGNEEDEVNSADEMEGGQIENALQIDVLSECSKFEMMVSNWIFENPAGESEEVIFGSGEFNITRQDMETLKGGQYVSGAIVDTWSFILNRKESLRADSSPRRFFATTYPTTFTIAMPSNAPVTSETVKTFSESFDVEFSDSSASRMEEIQLFFFPIFKSEHFFVVCFDVKKKFCHVLDNSSVGGNKTLKYDGVPDKLRQVFSQYLSTKGFPSIARVIQQTTASRLCMPWRDKDNKVDCGIFAMRHMETYMGGGIRNWDSGLWKNDEAQLLMMRRKYAAAICLDSLNDLREAVMGRVKVFAKKN